MHGRFEQRMGQKLAAARKRKGLLQRDVAAAIDISAHTLSRIEGGLSDISLYHFNNLCNLYEISPDRLLAYYAKEDINAEILNQLELLSEEKKKVLLKMLQIYNESTITNDMDELS